MPVMATKLYMPPPRPNRVPRPRLTRRLHEGLHRKLTLVSASAGSGKTTAASEWLAGEDRAVGWLSLDEGDNDTIRFFAYLLSAVRTAAAPFGEGLFGMFGAVPPPSAEFLMSSLLVELDALPFPLVLVLDDYHVIHAKPIREAVALFIERMPANVHLVLLTREDPDLPLARLRVRDQLNEIRNPDLRFSRSETDEFLRSTMGLPLTPEQIARLEARTEGWIAGLQLAAISLKNSSASKRNEPSAILLDEPAANAGTESSATEAAWESFTGGHRYLMDYLAEEVLQRLPDEIQTFVLHTSILDRLCGPLCQAVVGGTYAHDTLPALERLNLFLVPLDNERRWYRYHHLFAELLRRRLSQTKDGRELQAELHVRASLWFEAEGLDAEALRHAVAGNDIDRAARLMEGGGMPLHFRGALAPVLDALTQIPPKELDARPFLWVLYASALLMAGRLSGVEPNLLRAEAALQGKEGDGCRRDWIGHIASVRASAAVTRHDAETIREQSRLALEHLHPRNFPVRAAAQWTLGYACHLQGDREAARQAYTDAIAVSEPIGHRVIAVMAALGIGRLQEEDRLLEQAADTYRRALRLAGEPPLPVACEAHLGLARLALERGELDAALRHGEQSVKLSGMIENADRLALGRLWLARIRLARGEASEAGELLVTADRDMRAQPGAVSEEVRLLRASFADAAGKPAPAAGSPAKAGEHPPPARTRPALVEPLSERELEVLKLIACGLSNREIGERLYLALSTVKGYNRTIFGKLQASRRTEAVARARELELL